MTSKSRKKTEAKNKAIVKTSAAILAISVVAGSAGWLLNDRYSESLTDKYQTLTENHSDTPQSISAKEKVEASDLVYDALKASLRKDRAVSMPDTLERLADPSVDQNFDSVGLERIFAPNLDKQELLISQTVFTTIADQLAPSGKLEYNQSSINESVYQSKSGSYHVPLSLFTKEGNPPLTIEVVEIDGRLYIDPYSIVHQVQLSAVVGGEAEGNPYPSDLAQSLT